MRRLKSDSDGVGLARVHHAFKSFHDPDTRDDACRCTRVNNTYDPECPVSPHRECHTGEHKCTLSYSTLAYTNGFAGGARQVLPPPSSPRTRRPVRGARSLLQPVADAHALRAPCLARVRRSQSSGTS